MCRFLAYRGEPLLLETLVAAPAHSLIHQSMHATEAKTETNGDGFGIGWYGERTTPGLYREVHPAWSDENLRSLCAQVRAGLFFAHVRAATGTATTRANCHPFSAGRWLFMHNGQVGGWAAVRRRVEAMIPDALYNLRGGTTDSEAILLCALAQGLRTIRRSPSAAPWPPSPGPDARGRRARAAALHRGTQRRRAHLGVPLVVGQAATLALLARKRRSGW